VIHVPLVNLRFSWKVLLKNNILYLLMLSTLRRLFGRKFGAKSNPWIRSICEADLAVAVSGGDSFSDIYGLGRFFYVYLPQLLVVILGTKLVLLPQTIGPFRTGLARWLATLLLRSTQLIYSRDQASIEEVKGLLGGEGSRARFCYDMGFILEPRQPDRCAFGDLDQFERLKCNGRLLAGLNVSGLLLMGGYSGGNAFDFKVDYRELIERTIDFLVRTKGTNVVLIPHVFGSHAESDLIAATALFEALKDRYPGRLACVRGTYDQNEIKYIVGQCDVFIGARMHACIAALSQAIPAIGIAYSRKFIGVFETVGAGSLVADPRSLAIGEILEVVSEAIGRRAEISECLRATMVEARRKLYASLDGIA
jgi:polysaccharide pyruvyl transferase WcaK-like protein